MTHRQKFRKAFSRRRLRTKKSADKRSRSIDTHNLYVLVYMIDDDP